MTHAPSSPVIPACTQQWLELFEQNFSADRHSAIPLTFYAVPKKKITEQNAHNFIEAAFRFKDSKVTNVSALKEWGNLMQHCLELHPSNMMLGVQAAKDFLSKVHSLKSAHRPIWNDCANQWIRHFISAKDHALVKLLWDSHHFNGDGKDLAHCAVYTNDVELLEIFLDRVDPRVNKFELLKAAISCHSIPMFDRLFVSSSIKNKTEVLDHALCNLHPRSVFRSRPFIGTDAEKAKHDNQQLQNKKALEYMIERLIPQADLNAVFFMRKITTTEQWMIEHLSSKSMKRLKQAPYYEQVKDLPEYQRRILRDSIHTPSVSHTRKM